MTGNHCCFAGCDLFNCGRCGEQRCAREFHHCLNDDGYDLLSDDGMDDPSPEAIAEAEEIRSAMQIPYDISLILLRALVWCGDQITPEQREKAWTWVEDARGPVEEMGQ